MKLPPENECGCAEYKYKFDEIVLTKKPKRKDVWVFIISK